MVKACLAFDVYRDVTLFLLSQELPKRKHERRKWDKTNRRGLLFSEEASSCWDSYSIEVNPVSRHTDVTPPRQNPGHIGQNELK